jgi:hypothetical protein
MDGPADHVFDRGDRGEIDDRHHFARNVGETEPGCVQHPGRAAQLVGAEAGEKCLDRRAAFGRAQIAPRGLVAFRLDGQCMTRIVKASAQPGQAFVAHQHEVALFRLMAWCGRLEARRAVLDGVEAIGRQSLHHLKLRAREGLRRKPLHRIAVNGVNLCPGHRRVVSPQTAACLAGARKSPAASTAANGRFPHSSQSPRSRLRPIDRLQVHGLGQGRRDPPLAVHTRPAGRGS